MYRCRWCPPWSWTVMSSLGAISRSWDSRLLRLWLSGGQRSLPFPILPFEAMSLMLDTTAAQVELNLRKVKLLIEWFRCYGDFFLSLSNYISNHYLLCYHLIKCIKNCIVIDVFVWLYLHTWYLTDCSQHASIGRLHHTRLENCSRWSLVPVSSTECRWYPRQPWSLGYKMKDWRAHQLAAEADHTVFLQLKSFIAKAPFLKMLR